MFAPTGRTIALAIIAAPIALVIGLVRPDLWVVAPLWLALVLGALVYDGLMAARRTDMRLAYSIPHAVGVGEKFPVGFAVPRQTGQGAAQDITLSLAVDERLSPQQRIDAVLTVGDDGAPAATMNLAALRRGPARIARAWLGWAGPLRLARLQSEIAVDTDIAVVPSIRPLHDEVGPLFSHDAAIGQRLSARLGEGSEFESLVRFMPGMDRRSIDWKQSARHADLFAKQYEVERDNRIVIAVDSGRMMSDPVIGKDGTEEPRLDRAVSAALALSYAALKLEDRVSLSSFAARPQVVTREYTRLGDFAALRRASAAIDYSREETNYTLGLASIGAALKRRTMMVIFTEFADAITAEMMIGAAQRLASKHLLLFVIMADSELEHLASRVPETAQDVASATIAANLLRDRKLVVTRLRRMGAIVVEAPADGMAAGLLNAYIRIKRQGLI